MYRNFLFTTLNSVSLALFARQQSLASCTKPKVHGAYAVLYDSLLLLI